MIEKSVTIYARGTDGVYIHPSAFTEMGLLIAIQPFEHVAKDEIESLLWERVIFLLEKSGGRVPHPTEWNQLDPMIKMAGCKNWNTFAKKARMCTVDIENNKFIFIPHTWDGKGFEGLKSESIVLELGSDKSTYIKPLSNCLY